jgi:DNA-binding transcriptional LysR family regulator
MPCKNARVPDTDWNDLRYFAVVARTGTLSSAGREIGVAGTTVGRRIAALEKRLRTRLFDRTTEGFALTAAGGALIEQARGLEQGVIDLERRAQGHDARIAGTVRLATSDSLGVEFLARELGPLHRAHPEIELELISGQSSLNLLKREADLALRTGAKPTQGSLVAKRVGGVTLGLFASAAYLKRRPLGRSYKFFEGHELIGFDGEMMQSSAGKWIVDNAGAARIVMRVSNLLLAAEAAVAGWGIALLPSWVGKRRALEQIGPDPAYRNDVWLVVHEDLVRVPRVRAVMEHVIAACQRGLGSLLSM